MISERAHCFHPGNYNGPSLRTRQALQSQTSNGEAIVPAAKKVVLVVGGGGFVGSDVVKKLSSSNSYDVIALSRNEYDCLNENSEDAIKSIIQEKRPNVIVSCVGSINSDKDFEVNSATGKIAKAASDSASLEKFIYVSVSDMITSSLSDVSLFKPYISGKKSSEDDINSSIQVSSRLIIKPTFIYGGDAFGINPPRVTSSYGSFIRQLLSAPALKKLAEVSPPLVKLTLTPPQDVSDVSDAIIEGIDTGLCGVIDYGVDAGQN